MQKQVYIQALCKKNKQQIWFYFRHSIEKSSRQFFQIIKKNSKNRPENFFKFSKITVFNLVRFYFHFLHES